MPGNSSEYGLSISSEVSLFLMAFSSIYTVVGSIANLLVIVTILAAKELHRRSEDQLILNLAVTDFLSLSCLSFHVYVLSQGGLGQGYWSLYKCLYSTILFAGTNAILAIAIDRFIAVVFPMRHKRLMEGRNVGILIALSWASALAHGATTYLSDNRKESKYFNILSITIGLLNLLVTAVVYAIIFYCTRKQVRKTSKQRRSVGVEWKGYRHSHRLWKTAINTFVLVCLFYVTYIPVVVLVVYFWWYQERQWKDLWNERAWISAFIFLNSCLNPFVYSMRTKRFRKALNRKLRSYSC